MISELKEIQDLEAKEILSERFLEQIASLTSAFAWSVKKEGFSRGKLFLWDLLFLKQLSALGEHGVERTEPVLERLQESFSAYYKDERGDRLSRYWVNKEEGGRIFRSPIFLLLGEVIWLDVAKSSWMRKKKCPRFTKRRMGFYN